MLERMKTVVIALLVLTVPATAVQAQAKLIHVDGEGRTTGQSRSCESLRTFKNMSPSSTVIVKRFWEKVALPFFNQGDGNRAAQDAEEKLLYHGPVITHGPEEYRAFLQREEQLRRVREERKLYFTQKSHRRLTAFRQRQDALIASLPSADREGARNAMVAIICPPGYK